MAPPPKPFWTRVEKTATCWLWRGKVNRDGYGVYFRDGWNQMAHRWAWVDTGHKLRRGAILMHSCDNPPCVNPAHLRVGTAAQNVADKVAKKRHATGARVYGAILTDDAVRAIRARFRKRSPGVRGNVFELADEYGVCADLIWKVVTRIAWKHVE